MYNVSYKICKITVLKKRLYNAYGFKNVFLLAIVWKSYLVYVKHLG